MSGHDLPTVQGFHTQAGRVMLICSHDGQAFEYRTPTPGAYVLSGPRGEAVRRGQPYTLTLTPDGVPGPAFHVPADLWPGLMPALSGEGETGQRVARVEAVEDLPGPVPGAARLRLSTGHTLTLSRERTPRASFLPLTASGVPVLCEDWEDPAAWRVTIPRPEDAATLAQHFAPAKGGQA